MKWYECAGIGALMACLYGITLWASLQIQIIYNTAAGVDFLENASSSLRYATPTLYNATPKLKSLPDITYVPFEITGITMVIAFITLFSYPVWYPYAEEAFDRLAESIIPDDDEDEE